MAFDPTPVVALARERYAIKVKRDAGAPWPWTADPLLQRYHVCNVFRDDDAVSRYIMGTLLPANMDRPYATTVCSRLVNNETSLAVLYPAGRRAADWEARLQTVALNTSAYKLNTPLGLNNREGVRLMITRADAAPEPTAATLAGAYAAFVALGLGPFVAYQAAHDLKGTALPGHPADEDTWTYAGPGAIRGALRAAGHNLAAWVATKDFVTPKDGTRLATIKESHIDAMCAELLGPVAPAVWFHGVACELLAYARTAWPPEWPEWHLGEAEHMLCEYDKITRWREIGPGQGARTFHRPPVGTQGGLFE